MVKIVRRRLKDGTVKEYRYGDPTPRTVGAIVGEYRASRAFRKLNPDTQQAYDRSLQYILKFESVPIEKIRRRHVVGQVDLLADTPAKANKVLVAWQIILKFAVEREYIDFSPAAKIERVRTGEHGRWSDAAIEKALTLREPIRRGVLIGLYTGQRLSDCVRMTWADFDGTGIKVVQQKTGEPLWIPVHRILRAELATWDRTSTHILTNKYGTPWKRLSFAQAVSTEFRKHEELNGCVFHGLRKTAAARLAEAGCAPHQIAAITGHRSLQMLMHYTKEAQQKTMATAAIKRLENFGKTRKSADGNVLKMRKKNDA